MIAAIFTLRFTMYVAMAFVGTSGLATLLYIRDSAKYESDSEEHHAEVARGIRTFIVCVLCMSWALACRSVLPMVSP